MCDYRQFTISVSADSFSESPGLKSKYAFFLDVADNYQLNGYTIDDFYDWVIGPLLPKFRQLPAIGRSLTLQHFLFPKTHSYRIRGDGERLIAVPCDGTIDVAPLFGIRLPEDTCAPWSPYDPKDIRLPEKGNSHGPLSYTPSKVLLKDNKCAFFKPVRRGSQRSFVKELDKYGSIRNADFDESLRISRLLGLVRNETGQVFGLLLTYVDCSHKTLACAAKPNTPEKLRQRWAEQVHETVHQLHAAGIAWGDAKPDNVLIDYKNNAWLVDLGGGYTEGWVPKELSGSREGDLHALGKIDELLQVTRKVARQ